MREAKVYCEIHPWDVGDDLVRRFGAQGIILSGSHLSAYDESTAKAPQAVFDAGVPVLGICYGMQTMAQQLGGRVEAGKVREFGYAEVRARGHTRLLDGIEDFRTAEGHGMLKVWMSHGDKVVDLPPGFKLMASTDACPIAGMADESRRFYGVQFHPEVTHTLQGKAILQRFVYDICGCTGDWTMPDYASEAVACIRAEVGADEVILGLSGGVDSSVAAALIHKAIGDQLTCVFVDHGLLRLNEAQQVMDAFAKHMHVKVIHVDAADEFYAALLEDPSLELPMVVLLVSGGHTQLLTFHGVGRYERLGTTLDDALETSSVVVALHESLFSDCTTEPHEQVIIDALGRRRSAWRALSIASTRRRISSPRRPTTCESSPGP